LCPNFTFVDKVKVKINNNTRIYANQEIWQGKFEHFEKFCAKMVKIGISNLMYFFIIVKSLFFRNIALFLETMRCFLETLPCF
jgi:hypothetical protein